MSRSPLFDLYDPYGLQSLNAETGLSDDPFAVVPVRRKPRVEDLLPQEEKESMLRYLANQGASGLSGFGWLLDTPGSMVRGLLSEGPMKAIAALWETADDRVSGRELLRQYGLAGKEDTWGNFGSGIASEILLDPLTYMTAGIGALLGSASKTAAGKLAFKAGMFADDLGLAARRAGMGKNAFLRQSLDDVLPFLDDGVRGQITSKFKELAGAQADELIKRPLTATNRVSLPLVGNYAFDLYGQRGGDAIATAADALGTYAKTSPYIGGAVRAANALVNPSLMGMRDIDGQLLGRGITDASNIAERAANQRLSNAIVDAARNIGEDVFRSPAFSDAFANFMERQYDQIAPEMAQFFQRGSGGARDLAAAAKRWQRESLKRAAERGIPLENAGLPNDIGYFFRQRALVDNPQYADDWARAYGRQYDSGTRVASVVGGGAQRKDYTRAFPRWVLNKMAQDEGLQQALRQANDATQARQVIDAWVARNAQSAWLTKAGGSPFAYIQQKVAGLDPLDPANAAPIADAVRQTRAAYKELADTIRGLPTQHAKNKIPFYGNSINDLSRYVRSRARNEATADVLLRELASTGNLSDVAADMAAGGNRYTIAEALKTLGFDTANSGFDDVGNRVLSKAEQAFVAARGKAGTPVLMPGDIDSLSLPRKYVDEMARRILGARVPYEATGLLKAADDFTRRFKTLALLFPSRYTRDMYSGSFAAATQDAFHPLDFFRGQRIGSGVYDSIPGRVRHLPDYQALNTRSNLARLRSMGPRFQKMTDAQLHDELMIRKFLADGGGQGLTSADAVSELGRGASNLSMVENAPGLAGKTSAGLLELIRKRPFAWDLWSLDKTRPDRNWLLEAGDRAAKASDDFNRIGTYLNRISKGDSPTTARQLADLTQVNYRPENFTEFEREFVKRLVPFYSYTKGITPLVYRELLENPSGLTGQSIRAINRASEPSEDRFTPEYLRQSAAIPIGENSILGVKTPGITRFLTNIDLPHEGLLNLFTPGIGNSVIGALGDSLMKTGQNILGQTNPLLKGPAELVTNRQFYTGRQLSDLYSMLENDLGDYGAGPLARIAEQVIANAPGGSRVLGITRQLRDNRISLAERLAKLGVNAITGVKVQDVDQERTARLAARTTLNQLLDQAKGIHTYENLFIKPEDLMKLSPQEQRQYLLYRTLQSEASRKSRERKKQQETLDPMAMLGIM